MTYTYWEYRGDYFKNRHESISTIRHFGQSIGERTCHTCGWKVYTLFENYYCQGDGFNPEQGNVGGGSDYRHEHCYNERSKN